MLRAVKIERSAENMYLVHLEGGRQLYLVVPDSLPIEERAFRFLAGLRENEVELPEISFEELVAFALNLSL